MYSNIDPKYIRSAHGEFIDFVNEIYSTFIELRYLHEDEVTRPPYNIAGKPSLATSKLRHLGFTDEVIALLGELPYPSHELLNKASYQDEGISIAPGSAALSYLEGSHHDHISAARQPLCDGEVGIPAWAFKLTTCGSDFGTNYLYDTRTKLMLRWDMQAMLTEYADQPYRAVAEARSIWIGELRSLDWLPWRVEYGNARNMDVYLRPTYKEHMSSLGSTNRYCLIEDDGHKVTPAEEIPGGDTVYAKSRSTLAYGVKTHIAHEPSTGNLSALKYNSPRLRASTREQHCVSLPDISVITATPSPPCAKMQRVSRKVEVAKAVQNRYMYKRNLYEECGWPKQFNGDEFEKRRCLLEEEHHDLIKRLGPQAMQISNTEQGSHLREWYKQKAGVHAAQ